MGLSNWTTKHPNFDNWGSGNFRLDGHVGGHYLSALALAYAACDDAATKAQLKERMDHMLSVMKDCQDKFDSNTQGLKGYIGGYPDNALWTDMYSGSTAKFNSARGNVPLYVQHKVMAGLRDAYIYGKSDEALTMFLKMCDWAVDLVAKYDTNTMQGVLIYKYPVAGNDLTLNKIIARRNAILKDNVPGMFENTWMTTGTYMPPTLEFIRFRGRDFAQVRGLWEVENDYMGGPFVSHSFYSPDGSEIICAEAFVYAPKYDKRQYLRQVESILFSWEWAK